MAEPSNPHGPFVGDPAEEYYTEMMDYDEEYYRESKMTEPGEGRRPLDVETAAEVCFRPYWHGDDFWQLVRVMEELVLPEDCESYTPQQMAEAMERALATRRGQAS